MKKIIVKIITVYLVTSLVYTPLLLAADPDLVSPVIEHQAATGAIKGGTPIKMLAKVTDDIGVKSVTLYYRTEGMTSYRTLEMGLDSESGQFTAIIPGDEVVTSSLEYYIQATDVNGNTVTRGGRNFPLSIALVAPPVESTPTDDKQEPSYTWAWVVGGLLLGAAALSGGGGGGGDDGGNPGKTGTIKFTGPQP